MEYNDAIQGGKAMFKGKSKGQKVFMGLLLAAYIGCCGVLIVEAALPGTVSADQSNAIGGGIADIINNNAGDQTVIVNPTSLALKTPEKSNLFVGESYSLAYTILPEDCSYKSVTFQSSDETVLTVSENGVVSAKGQGQATVTCYSTSFPDLKDECTFTVENVKEESIQSALSSVLGEDGLYHLEANRSYSISTSFVPANTTDKSLTYSVSFDGMDEETASLYAMVSDSTLYTTKVTPEGKPGKVTVTSANGKNSSFEFVSTENKVQVVDLQSISVKAKTTPQYELAINENISFTSKFTISFSPSNATYKSYVLESSDPTVIQVSGTTLKAKKVGECEIKVKPTQYSFSSSIRVKVSPSPIKSASISLNYLSEPRIKVGETSYLRYSSVSPSNADAHLQKLITYESSDSTILSVDQKTGKVTAKNQGTATASVKFYDSKEKMEAGTPALVKSIKVEVFAPAEVSDIEVTESLDESDDNSNILYNGKTYNLANSIKIAKMFDISGKEIDASREGISKTLTYSISAKSSTEGDLDSVKIVGDNLVLTDNVYPGKITIEYSHAASGIAGTYEYTLINEVKPTIDRDEDSRSLNFAAPTLSESLSLYVTSSGSISFPEHQSYRFTPEIGYENYAKITETTDTSLSFRGLDEGDFSFGVTPVYDGKELNGVKKNMAVHVRHKIATGFTLNLYLNENENPMDLSKSTLEDGSLAITLDVDSVVTMEALYQPFDNPTKFNLTVKGDKKTIGEYKENAFIFHKVGKVNFQVTEEVSGISKNILFRTVNRVKLDENNPISLKQDKASYDKETNTYHIENGMPAKIITNFDATSTFTKVTYESSDPTILKVGNDGNITPLKAGSADILCYVNDKDTIDITYTIHMVVEKKSLINNMHSFLYKIRKGLGHFGAFLITAVCSTLFYFFGFEKKSLFFSLPFSVIQGFFLAEFTEFIQLFTPGRSGLFSDVLIDFTGYSIGFGITIVALILFYLIRYLVKRYGKKKADDTKQD